MNVIPLTISPFPVPAQGAMWLFREGLWLPALGPPLKALLLKLSLGVHPVAVQGQRKEVQGRRCPGPVRLGEGASQLLFPGKAQGAP